MRAFLRVVTISVRSVELLVLDKPTQRVKAPGSTMAVITVMGRILDTLCSDDAEYAGSIGGSTVLGMCLS